MPALSSNDLIFFGRDFFRTISSDTSILSEFELNTISRYFPEYEIEIKKYYRKHWGKEKKNVIFVIR